MWGRYTVSTWASVSGSFQCKQTASHSWASTILSNPISFSSPSSELYKTELHALYVAKPFFSVCMCGVLSVHVCTWMWRSKVNIRCHSILTLFSSNLHFIFKDFFVSIVHVWVFCLPSYTKAQVPGAWVALLEFSNQHCTAHLVAHLKSKSHLPMEQPSREGRQIRCSTFD